MSGLGLTRRVFFLLVPFLWISTEVIGQLAADFYASDLIICSGSSVTFTDNSSGATASATYVWNFGELALPATASGRGPHTVVYTGSGKRTVSLTVTDGVSDTRRETDYITVNAIPPVPVVTVSDDCDGTSTLTTTASGSLLWSTMAMSTAIKVTNPGVYSVTTTVNGCTSLPGSGTASPKTAPASPVVSVDCSEGEGEAVISILSPLGAEYEYRLDGGSYRRTPYFTDVDNGSYRISVRNTSGCITTGDYFEVSCECNNGATVTLSSTSGITCGLTPITVSGNTFGGRATRVTISENGSGSVSPTISLSSPFTFTYTPRAGDIGKVVIITVTTNEPSGDDCEAAKEIYSLSVQALPVAPVFGNIIQPTCSEQTAKAEVTGLPAIGTWTLTQSPGGITSTGNGTGTTITNLLPGIYTFTVTSEAGCVSPSSGNLVITAQPPDPDPPKVDNITHPTCNIPTGSVGLTGLPATGTWTLIRSPGAVRVSGSGTSKVISGLPPGTYTFTVTNSTGCTSPATSGVVIHSQPASPATPVIGTIVHPTCTTPTGSVELSGLPASGTWTLTRNQGNVKIPGSGISAVIAGLSAGTYTFTVTNSAGCNSPVSSGVVINSQPVTPATPIVGTIVLPACTTPTGSVTLTGLPATGTWTLTRNPGAVIVTGSGTSRVISGLSAGTYTFIVTNQGGCSSGSSSMVTIPQQPGIPQLIITDPAPLCSPANFNLTDNAITAGSTVGLTLTYWRDINATVPFASPATATEGTYYIKGTTSAGCYDIKAVTAVAIKQPLAYAGPDQVIEYVFATTMNADPANDFETGAWSIISGKGEFADFTDAKTSVTGLSPGTNVFLWTVSTVACPASSDTVNILVVDFQINTLLTPNMDGRNDYFIIRGLPTLGKIELTIFNRQGVRVYQNLDYDNSWDGVDLNGKPLPEDTYFYLLRSENGRSEKGFVVIRR